MSSAELTVVFTSGATSEREGFLASLTDADGATGFDVQTVDGSRIAAALDRVETPFVTFTDATSPGGPVLAKALEHARKVAVRTGVDDAALPLLVLSGWSDRPVVTAFGKWAAERPQVQQSAIDDYLYLLPFQGVSVSLHGLDVIADGQVLRFTGTCRRGGTVGDSPADHRVVLRFLVAGGSPVEVDTEPQLRFEDGAERWTGFTGDIALDQVPLGVSALEIHLDGPPGQDGVRRPLRGAIGMLAASRPVVAGGRRLQVLPIGRSDRLELVAHRAPGVLPRLRWTMYMAARDIRALVRRRAFTWVRGVRFVTRPLFARKPVWLVGERPDTARDNGYHLFAYLRRERRDVRAYYVIDRGSDQHATVAGFGHVVAHSSWQHRLLMLHATVLANAYSIKHMIPRKWTVGSYMRHFAWRAGSYRVYLKHGVNVNTKALRRRVGGYDLYLTATAAETTASRETSGYDRQIVQTGLPRYDALVPTPSSRTVLFMPTWRLYLAAGLFNDPDHVHLPFEGSTYQRFVVDFLGSPRLRDLLEEHDYRLQFMPHYNLREHLADVGVGSDRIDVLDGAAADIQDIMRGCDLFVTDHSSVHFDLAYLGTPVIYSHFDAADYAAGHAEPSWFDHERDGFGPVTGDLDSTLDALEHYLSTDCRREDVYTGRAEQSFAHTDRNNCERTVAAIEDLVRTRGYR